MASNSSQVEVASPSYLRGKNHIRSSPTRLELNSQSRSHKRALTLTNHVKVTQLEKIKNNLGMLCTKICRKTHKDDLQPAVLDLKDLTMKQIRLF